MTSYEELALKTQNPIAKRLISIIVAKKTNLCVSVDVTSPKELISIIRQVGPHVCMIKTHIDIISPFSDSLIHELNSLAAEYNFLLFEDRKFADIGNTVSLQYSGGVYKIVEWADIVTVHAIPGPGVIAGLRAVTQGLSRGALILAEMSSNANLCTPEYQTGAIEIAIDNPDFVLGFIAQRPMVDGFLTVTPGVQISNRGDGLGQQYRDPREVVKKGSDVIIVGRGITCAQDIQAAALLYKGHGWQGYLDRFEQSR